MQEDPLIATGLEIMAMLQQPDDSPATIEYIVLAGTEFENSQVYCVKCLKHAVSMLRQHRAISLNDADMVRAAMDGQLSIDFGRVFWNGEQSCMVCSVVKQGRMPRYRGRY